MPRYSSMLHLILTSVSSRTTSCLTRANYSQQLASKNSILPSRDRLSEIHPTGFYWPSINLKCERTSSHPVSSGLVPPRTWLQWLFNIAHCAFSFLTYLFLSFLKNDNYKSAAQRNDQQAYVVQMLRCSSLWAHSLRLNWFLSKVSRTSISFCTSWWYSTLWLGIRFLRRFPHVKSPPVLLNACFCLRTVRMTKSAGCVVWRNWLRSWRNTRLSASE